MGGVVADVVAAEESGGFMAGDDAALLTVFGAGRFISGRSDPDPS
jgi:hypothetical protein